MKGTLHFSSREIAGSCPAPSEQGGVPDSRRAVMSVCAKEHASSGRLLWPRSISQRDVLRAITASFALLLVGAASHNVTLLSVLLQPGQQSWLEYSRGAEQEGRNFSSGQALAAPGRPRNAALQLADEARHFVLVLDLWERMVNVQGGLKRLVQLGVDAGFTVVEPFVFESKVSRHLSVPRHFEKRGLAPQPASTYFSTDELHSTSRFVSFDAFASLSKSSDDAARIHLDAVLYFTWDEANGDRAKGAPFYWCDERLEGLGMPEANSSTPVWHLADDVVVAGALCVSPAETMQPGTFTSAYFEALFAAVAKRSERSGQTAGTACPSCVSVALLNYRKHAFSGYVSSTGAQPFKSKNPAMQVGQAPRQLASRLRRGYFADKPYTALQMRTGKTWVLCGRRPQVFIPWLSACIDRAVVAVQVAKAGLGRDTAVYIASDMYNDGWKGGESCPPEVCEALRAGRRRIDRALRPRHFEPADFNVTQDIMGMSSAVDAAMCVAADRLVFTSPSNLGRWAHDQRSPLFLPAPTNVDCNDIAETGPARSRSRPPQRAVI